MSAFTAGQGDQHDHDDHQPESDAYRYHDTTTRAITPERLEVVSAATHDSLQHTPGHRCAPAEEKKSINATAPPVSPAATNDTNTPLFPLPASTGLAEWEPTAQAAAAMARPASDATKPMVSNAPTMFSSSLMPGRPVVFGVTLTPAPIIDRGI
jgi:hypothetical protein